MICALSQYRSTKDRDQVASYAERKDWNIEKEKSQLAPVLSYRFGQ